MYTVDELIKRYPILCDCKENIIKAYDMLVCCFEANNKLLVVGNGGSAADSEHIVGELAKAFTKKRKVSAELREKLLSVDKEKGLELADNLQPGLKAIALTNHQSLNTAFINDVPNGGLLSCAQQVNVYGNENDVLLAISTSGNSKNIHYATITAKAKGLKIIGLTGKNGGVLANMADVCIKVNETETFKIQELHLPIYHLLCLMLEEHFYSEF